MKVIEPSTPEGRGEFMLSINVLKQRIEHALEVANRYGGIDGAHHKTWVIDQMVRALTGAHESDGVSKEYREWLKAHCDGEDGPDTYDWDEGIAP